MIAAAACGSPQPGPAAPAAQPRIELPEITVSDAELEGNPFRQDWETPFGIPPFSEFEDGHYLPAVKQGLLERRAEIEAITSNPDAPDFENTILALERSGQSITKVIRVSATLRTRISIPSSPPSKAKSTRC